MSDEPQPRAYGRRASDQPGYQPLPPAPQPAPPESPDTYSTIQVVLTILALTTIPLSSWLFIENHVDKSVSGSIDTYDRLITGKLNTNAADIHMLQYNVQQLCRAVRASDPTFACQIRQFTGYR